MDKNGSGFLYLKEKFPKISDAKIKEGIFVGPQIRQIMKSIIKENLEKQFYLRIKSILKSKLNGNNLIKAVNTYAVPLLTYSFGVIKWSKTNLQNINIQTRVLFTKWW
jgi:hypothetical protein